jgi:tetratricopeptide (TPR) repeat protein
VYFGPKDPKDVKKSAVEPLKDIQRGVLLETWAYEGGGINTLDEVQSIFARAKKFLGADFQPNIWLGVNPFGPENKIARRFTGWIFIPREQEGDFGLTSDSSDASFILMNDQLAVANGGGGGRAGDVRKEDFDSKGTRLKGGQLHKLTYLHVNLSGDPSSTVAWRLPGAAKTAWNVIDPKFFAPVGVARVGPLEQYGQSQTLDFAATHAGETFAGGKYYQRMSFKASYNTGGRPDCTWDFGDGQTARGDTAEHVYLKAGEYKVTVTVGQGDKASVRTNRVFVQRPWATAWKDELDPLVRHIEIIKKYNYGTLPQGQAAEVIRLMEIAERNDDIIAAGKALVASGSASTADLEGAMPIVYKVMWEKKLHNDAVTLFSKASELAKDHATRAMTKTMAAQNLLALRDAKSVERAFELFDEVVRKHSAASTTPYVREANIGKGDVYRLRKDADRARRAYRDAGILGGQGMVSFDLERGGYARHIEDYLRSASKTKNPAEVKQFYADAQANVEMWAYKFPSDKMDGYWSLLKVQTDIATGQLAEAILECETLANVSPTSNYAAQLLMIQSQLHERQREPAKAKAALERIVEQHKESPLAEEAAKKLVRMR